MIINITSGAVEELNKTLETQAGKMPRVYLGGFGWSGPNLGLSLDEEKENDIQVESGGITFLVDEDMTEFIKEVYVDYVSAGFRRGFTISTTPNGKGGC